MQYKQNIKALLVFHKFYHVVCLANVIITILKNIFSGSRQEKEKPQHGCIKVRDFNSLLGIS